MEASNEERHGLIGLALTKKKLGHTRKLSNRATFSRRAHEHLDGKVWVPAPSPGFQGSSVWLEVLAGDYWLTTDGPAVWRSEDGETWVEVPLPAGYSQTPYGSIHEVNGAVWLTGTDPLGVWRLDGTNWTSLDPGLMTDEDITLPNGWIKVIGGPVALGGITVVPWDFENLSLIDSNDQGTAVTPPWGPLRDQAPEGTSPELTVLASRSRFLAYITHYIPGTRCAPTREPADPNCVPEPQEVIEMWTSADGLTWTGPNRPEFLPEGDSAYGTFRTEGELVIGEVYDPSGLGQVWISEDGINWSNTGIPGQYSFSFIGLDSGAIYFGDHPHLEMFFSADLRNWDRVDVSAVSAFGGNGTGRSMTGSAGDTAFFMITDDETGRHAMWILELQK